MIGDDLAKLPPFTYEVDDAIQDSILNLDQKLKGLLSEIETQKTLLASTHDAGSIEQHKHLLHFSLEIKKALASMGTVVDMVSNEDDRSTARTGV